MPESHVLRWEDGEPGHPVITELRANPDRWAVIYEGSTAALECDLEAFFACDAHPRVQVYVKQPPLSGPTQRISARWMTDAEWAEVLRRPRRRDDGERGQRRGGLAGGGYGG